MIVARGTNRALDPLAICLDSALSCSDEKKEEMIVTLTLNPAVDLTIFVPALKIGEVHRVHGSTLDPAGKGINASRVADRLGMASIAFGFLGGEMGALVQRTLNEEGVQSHFLRVPQQTRINVTAVDRSSNTSTSFYEGGPHIDPAKLNDLQAEMIPWLSVCKVLVLAGSLPPGVPDDIYSTYIRLAHSYGAKTILDTHGSPLRLGLSARPYLIKPNVAETEGLLQRPLPDQNSVITAAQDLVRQGIEVVVISMGGDGAICACGGDVWLAIPPKVDRQSTVGSGDSMVAGLAVTIARGEPIEEGLKLGTAAGAATAMTPGTALGSKNEILELLPFVKLEKIAQVE